MAGMERAKRAVWTRVGHAGALIDRMRVRVLEHPYGGNVLGTTLYIPLQTFLSKFKGLFVLSLCRTGTIPYQ